jgi:hypothetical protein
MKPVPDDAYVFRHEDWVRLVKTPDSPRYLLPELLSAISERIGN